jgi:hypothetical protein
MVLSPMPSAPEPVLARSGVYKGHTVLREEEAEGWTFMNTASTEAACVIEIGSPPFDGYASGFKTILLLLMAACRPR